MAEANHVESELDSRDARLDFENVLQEVLEKANAEEKIPSDLEEDKDSSNEESKIEEKDLTLSPLKPFKFRPERKWKRRKDLKDDSQKAASPYVMKLFDRSVDLAPFADHTPLYPICRAWMENDPHKKNRHLQTNGHNHEEPVDVESSEDEDSLIIKKIPQPNKPWSNINAEGKYQSPRIPAPLTQPDHGYDKFVRNKSDPPPPANTLLLHHLQHWKKVRQTWKAKSIENEERYKDGMNMLLDVFYRNNNSNSQ